MLYQGAIAEAGGTTEVIENPKHPYVQLLIDSIPVPDPKVSGAARMYYAGRRADARQRQERLPLLWALSLPHGALPHQASAALHRRASEHVASCYLYDQDQIAAPSPDDVAPLPAGAEIKMDNEIGQLYEKEPKDKGVV